MTEPAVTETQESTAPVRLKIAMVESREDYGRFVAEPLERGFALTLGNALRRALLSSLPGASITSVKIEGVHHEYSSIPLVKEDIAEMLLNIKAIRLRPLSNRPGTLRLEIQGPGQVIAGDIQPSADFEIANPGQYLASLDSEKARLSIQFQAELGKGYVPATHTDGMPIDVLPVDAIFTPIRRVSYTIEKMRVGQVTDYERLVLEVRTDGTLAPLTAMREASQILVDAFLKFAALGQSAQEVKGVVPEYYDLPIERLVLSARTLNCLKRGKIHKVGEVLQKSQAELLSIKNFGKKSLNELYTQLRAAGYRPPEAEPEEPAEAAVAMVGEEEGPAAPLVPKQEARGRRPETLKGLAALRALLQEEPPPIAKGEPSPTPGLTAAEPEQGGGESRAPSVQP